MKRVLFTLSMPNRGSWNGGWSGSGNNYCKIKSMTDKRAEELGLKENESRSWYHSWDDGWCARIDGKIMKKGERKPKSDGFYGYDWMVTNIWLYGNTREKE